VIAMSSEGQDPGPGMWLTLRLRDVPAMTGWLTAIGFVPHAEYRDDAGDLVHGEYLWPKGGGVMVGAHRASPDWPQAPGAGAAYLVVEDVDRTHAAAVDAGATSLRAPVDEDYGGRGSTVRDPEGNLWSFGTYRPGAA
jgi:uncharacterized glyoxalase superfamily protein PhnB